MKGKKPRNLQASGMSLIGCIFLLLSLRGEAWREIELRCFPRRRLAPIQNSNAGVDCPPVTTTRIVVGYLPVYARVVYGVCGVC